MYSWINYIKTLSVVDYSQHLLKNLIKVVFQNSNISYRIQETLKIKVTWLDDRSLICLDQNDSSDWNLMIEDCCLLFRPDLHSVNLSEDSLLFIRLSQECLYHIKIRLICSASVARQGFDLLSMHRTDRDDEIFKQMHTHMYPHRHKYTRMNDCSQSALPSWGKGEKYRIWTKKKGDLHIFLISFPDENLFFFHVTGVVMNNCFWILFFKTKRGNRHRCWYPRHLRISCT